MTATATENPIRAEHAAAAVMREATSTRADVAALQALKATEGAKTMFQRETVPAEDEKKPDFTEIHAVLGRFIPPRPDLQQKADRLQEIIEKQPPAVGAPNGPDAHLKMIGEVAANMPGMVAAIAKETGLSPAVVKSRLRGNLNSMRPILRRLQADQAFINQLSKDVANVEYSEEMQDLDSRFQTLENKVTTRQTELDQQKWTYTNVGAPLGTPPGAREWYNGLTAVQQAGIRGSVQNMESENGYLNVPTLGALTRSNLSRAQVPVYEGQIDTQLTTLFGNNYAALSVPGALNAVITGMGVSNQEKVALRNQGTALLNAYAAAERMRAIYNANPNFENDMKKLKLYDESTDKLREIQAEQTALDQEKAQRDKLKLQRDKKLKEYGNKVDSALDRAFREYYNDVLLKEAEQIAEYDANKKTEDKKKTEDLKTKREQDARELLSKYLRLSYLKYQGGKVVGWDDDTIKHFVKQDLLSSSPAQMGRKLLERVQSYRGTLPPTYQAEINKVLADMGVTAGPPPVTFANILNGMDKDFMAQLAADEMPKVLGYAYARGYYFDRLRMTKDQAEFVKSAYGQDFFERALSSRDEIVKQFEAEFGKGVLSGEMSRKIRQALAGKDWEEGMGRLMKVAALGGMTVAGLSFLGGTAGIAGGINTLGAVGKAGADVIRAASQATAYGLRTGANFVSTEAAKAAGMVNPIPGAPHIVPEPPPITPTPGGSA